MLGKYHANLQTEGMAEQNLPSRDEAVNAVLEAIECKFSPESVELLARRISETDVGAALRVASNWKSPGLDGIPYELWKSMKVQYDKQPSKKENNSTQNSPEPENNDIVDTCNSNNEWTPLPQNHSPEANFEDGEDLNSDCSDNSQTVDSESESSGTETDSVEDEDTAPDILGILAAVFNDIEDHGVSELTSFAEGWLCSLYKKKDRVEMANYRPLTILNTDYKLITKILASKLGDVATEMLHESQAGFVKGRQITDQTRLIEVVLEYAKATGTNGLIVALDQEKAYDKIAHDYLWLVLEKYGIPMSTINLIQTLYSRAETHAMVNGHLGHGYIVNRGVCQGDPMSCLLFDLAIEPLASLMRQSPKLKGLKIPGLKEKLIVNLFADDTTVFLNNADKFEDLQAILDKWCTASTARFNIGKTEIIPLGSDEYRTQEHK
ncbi:hypothetical protein CVT25_006781 [Psilocybe cyanescens]|uniref:Reverse transcriptase domain-containing protein n=1 Tax=Psilocybe cyanescens TaxID=93625 RepID=A0A409X455_PSICY|nr:hypothetical protein CVT25_006781 [Psilocybe cyanescens]